MKSKILHEEGAVVAHKYTCKVIHPGRSFLQREIVLLALAKQPHHRIRLNVDLSQI